MTNNIQSNPEQSRAIQSNSFKPLGEEVSTAHSNYPNIGTINSFLPTIAASISPTSALQNANTVAPKYEQIKWNGEHFEVDETATSSNASIFINESPATVKYRHFFKAPKSKTVWNATKGVFENLRWNEEIKDFVPFMGSKSMAETLFNADLLTEEIIKSKATTRPELYVKNDETLNTDIFVWNVDKYELKNFTKVINSMTKTLSNAPIVTSISPTSALQNANTIAPKYQQLNWDATNTCFKISETEKLPNASIMISKSPTAVSNPSQAPKIDTKWNATKGVYENFRWNEEIKAFVPYMGSKSNTETLSNASILTREAVLARKALNSPNATMPELCVWNVEKVTYEIFVWNVDKYEPKDKPRE